MAGKWPKLSLLHKVFPIECWRVLVADKWQAAPRSGMCSPSMAEARQMTVCYKRKIKKERYRRRERERERERERKREREALGVEKENERGEAELATWRVLMEGGNKGKKKKKRWKKNKKMGKFWIKIRFATYHHTIGQY